VRGDTGEAERRIRPIQGPPPDPTAVTALGRTARAARFDAFAAEEGDRLRRVLVARHGVDIGNDLCADALTLAWERWDEIGAMANPTGYLYRVAQSASRRYRRWGRTLQFPVEFAPHQGPPDGSGDIFLSLGRLKPVQRTCVVMVHAYRWTYQEVADVLDVPVTTVTNHVHRGMKQLRADLGESR
jgi:DNA-directed RNA polymerase specialized sigma24 family protein